MKRGEAHSSIELWFLIAAFALAAIAGADLLLDTVSRVEGTFLEKNYIARDLGMTIEAIYAAPADITYEYNIGDYDFFFEISRDKVVVKNPDGMKEPTPVSFRIVAENSNIEFADYSMIAVKDNCPFDRKIILSKTHPDEGPAIISVSGKNVRFCKLLDEGCKENTVLLCEQ